MLRYNLTEKDVLFNNGKAGRIFSIRGGDNFSTVKELSIGMDESTISKTFSLELMTISPKTDNTYDSDIGRYCYDEDDVEGEKYIENSSSKVDISIPNIQNHEKVDSSSSNHSSRGMDDSTISKRETPSICMRFGKRLIHFLWNY